MLRTRLTVLIFVLLATVLLAASTLVWTVSRAQYYLERSRLAHEELNAYTAVSEAAYRHFKQLGDIAVAGDTIDGPDLGESATQLRVSLDRLRTLTQEELAFVDRAGRAEERPEIDRVDAITEIVDTILREYGALTAGTAEPQRLAEVTENRIDGELRQQIDAAIADEAKEAARADTDARRLLARLVFVAIEITLLGLLLSAIALYFLTKHIRRPMTALMAGVRAFTAGELNHRTRLSGEDEFSRLGQALDDMAARLESQRRELLTARNTLAETVQARTAELAAANEELKRIDARRQEFLANVSHELRTPVTIIRGEADVTLRGGEKPIPEYTETLTRIADQAARLAKLVNDLLLIARSDAGALPLALAPVPLTDLVGQARDHAASLTENDIRIIIDAPNADIAAWGDRDRLMQLVMILLDNAVRYSGTDKEVRIAVGADDEMAWLTIADNGPGIPAEDMDSVFERFYRGASARAAAPQGAGLGLNIAKAIVESHNGDITMKGGTGGRKMGTAVTVRLPRAETARLRA